MHINKKPQFNFALAFVVGYDEQEKKKTQSRKGIFLYDVTNILFIINEVFMGRPSQGLES
jgi:hypothetical protein